MDPLGNKLTLLRELLAVSRRQGDLLRVDDAEADLAEPLLAIVEQRDSLITAINELDAAGRIDDPGVRELLLELQQSDEDNRRLLEAGMKRSIDGVSRVRGARRQLAGYGDPPAMTGQLFDGEQ